MSKSPNTSSILIPALGGAALVMGVAFGVSNRDYAADEIGTLRANYDQSQAAASEQGARVTELESSLAEMQSQSEQQIAAAQQEAERAARAAEQAQARSAQEIERLKAALAAAQSSPRAADAAEGTETAATDTAAQPVAGDAMASTQGAPATGGKLGLGRPALEEEIAAWDVDVLPDGRGLPVGGMSVADGEEVYIEKCSSCHGDFAEGRGAWPVLAGGFDTLDNRDPVKTVGSYWPYLSTVWDYVHRSMPFGGAGTLTADETYGVVAYILYSNDLVDDEDFVLSNETFSEVEMYNTDGFIVDDRAATEYGMWSGEPCMSDCKDAPAEITRRATDVGVTPSDDGSMAQSLMEEQLAQLGGTEWGAERVAGSVFMMGDPEEGSAQDEAQLESPDPQMASAEAAEEEPGAEAATEEEAPAEQAAATEEAPAAAAPDPQLVAAGETVFKKCQSCHAVGADAKNKTGPQLNNLMGRVIGGVEGYRYSKPFQALAEEGKVWDDESIHAFLTDPKGYIKGTKMSFRGPKTDEEINAVVAYIEANSE